MTNERTDASNKEQLVICKCWIGKDLVHEDETSLYAAADISAQTIVKIIKDALVRMNLGLNKCPGQCYNGASTMSGPTSGVTNQLCD